MHIKQTSSLFLVAILRPKTASKTSLLLFVTISLAQAATIAQNPKITGIVTVLQLLFGLGSTTIILCTPMRNPRLTKDDISPVYGTPTFELRSPEDNLMLWQFLSVSWMAPLISLGKKRQLNDEDVWGLAYEFKHRLLHDKFREMKGSILAKLVKANAIDLVLLCVLGTIDEISRKLISKKLNLGEILITPQTLLDLSYYNSFCEPWKTLLHHKVQPLPTLL
jgi:hypothetical protein